MLLTLLIITFSLQGLAIVGNSTSGKGGAGGADGGGGNAGGASGGTYGDSVSGLPIGDYQLSISDGLPQFSIKNVKPNGAGGCIVTGVSSGAWAGSPCEKLYGATPL